MRATTRCFLFLAALVAVLATWHRVTIVPPREHHSPPKVAIRESAAREEVAAKRRPLPPRLSVPAEPDSIPPLPDENPDPAGPEEIQRIQGMTDWPGFYAALGPTHLSYDERMDLIIDRLKQERSWNEEDCEFLRDALLEEDAETTNRAEKAGVTAEAFKATFINARKRLTLENRVRDIRVEVRREREAKFRSRFDEPSMDVIREHLRNDQVWFCETFGEGCHIFLLRAGGKS
ncbi:MAG: hypothetical protein AAB074_18210 [Planctomycetota bacterium]